MQCILHIPGLLPPREALAAIAHTLHAPHLKTLLARGRETQEADGAGSAQLCRAFGIARQQDWPLAPLLARSSGLPAIKGYWLCATPVHLETRRNALVLSRPAANDISAAESAALVATLAAHLREEGVTLHEAHPGQWLVQVAASPMMTTTDLEHALNHDVREFLPQGKDSRRWHRLLTEMQMLLHRHPVNDAREAAGKPPLNSVWLWGGGVLPRVSAAPMTAAWSDDEVVRALAHHTGSRIEPAPPRIAPDTLDQGTHFFSTALLAAPLREGDLRAWSVAMNALDRNWFQPLLAALSARRVRHLSVTTTSQDHTLRWTIHPADLLKIWRKNKYL